MISRLVPTSCQMWEKLDTFKDQFLRFRHISFRWVKADSSTHLRKSHICTMCCQSGSIWHPDTSSLGYLDLWLTPSVFPMWFYFQTPDTHPANHSAIYDTAGLYFSLADCCAFPFFGPFFLTSSHISLALIRTLKWFPSGESPPDTTIVKWLLSLCVG